VATAVIRPAFCPNPRRRAGVAERQLDEPCNRQAADLCRKAGADLEAIPAWIEERAAPD